jgi:hypothetical protein
MCGPPEIFFHTKMGKRKGKTVEGSGALLTCGGESCLVVRLIDHHLDCIRSKNKNPPHIPPQKKKKRKEERERKMRIYR